MALSKLRPLLTLFCCSTTGQTFTEVCMLLSARAGFSNTSITSLALNPVSECLLVHVMTCMALWPLANHPKTDCGFWILASYCTLPQIVQPVLFVLACGTCHTQNLHTAAWAWILLHSDCLYCQNLLLVFKFRGQLLPELRPEQIGFPEVFHFCFRDVLSNVFKIFWPWSHRWLLYAQIGMHCNAIHANTRTMYWHVLWYVLWHVLVVCIEYMLACIQY